MSTITTIKSIKRIPAEDRYDISVKENENFFADGILVHNCRLITIIDESGKIRCMSRNGKEFTTLTRLKEEIKELWPNLHHCVFDGEICIVDEEGDEHFDQIIRLVNRKDYTIAFPKYRVFDILNLDEFGSGTSKDILSARQSRWENFKKSATRETTMLVPLDQWKVRNRAHMDEMFKEANDKNWEGLILRKDTTYVAKRSNDLLKVKSFQDREYVVTRIGTGPFSIVKDGKETSEMMLTQIYFNHEWKAEDGTTHVTEVGSGSGFTQDQRREFYAHPERIVGKVVKIKFFEETTDQNGNHSLRFPVVLQIYGDDGRFD